MKFGVIGDIHGFWDERDTAFFNASDYDMLLLVGDFARVANSLPVARQLGSSAAETASDARFRFSTPDEHLFHPTSAPSTAYLVVHNAECVLVG